MLKKNGSSNQKQILLFLIVGIINTIFGYAFFAFFIFLKLHYTVAVLLSTLVGILFNFNTTGRIVFNNKDNYRIFLFFAIYGVLYFINVSILKIASAFQPNMYMNGLISTVITAALSFILNKYIVFAEKSYETH